MKGYRFPLTLTVYAGLLLLVGLLGGNVWLMLAVSALALISFGLGLIFGHLDGSGRAIAGSQMALAKALEGRAELAARLHELEPQVSSLTARNRMLVGLVAKDPVLLADFKDFLAWREDLDAAQDQAIANVTRERS